MSAIRTFIAIQLPTSIHDQLSVVLDQINQPPVPGVRWVPPHNIHLTLRFLGDVSPTSLKSLAGAIHGEASRHKPFEITVEGLGAFPSKQRPRVIWVGITAPGALARLQHGIENEANHLGYPPEERPFSAHLTVGRVSSHAAPAEIQQVSQRLEQINPGKLGSFTVDSVKIFKSDLNPSGSIYTVLYSLPLSEEKK